MPNVTVVIPVYNVERYLKKCVDSVLAQTFTDYEIILVDDGSTDNSGILCDEYAASHPCISVIHQQNKGLGGARNTGIAAAKGDYLLFLDSDDSLHPEALEICWGKAKQYDCDMVLFDLIATYENGSFGARYTCSPIKENTVLADETLASLLSVSSACNRLCKRDLFVQTDIRFPNKVWYEDLRTIPKMVPHLHTAYYYAEQPLYYYFQRSDSIMHTPDFDRIVRERIAAVDEIWTYYSTINQLDTYSKELDFLWIFHGFFLPVREMLATGKPFAHHADILRSELVARCSAPLQNPYLSSLTVKEQKMLSLFWNRRYFFVYLLSHLNKWLKKVKHVFTS